MFVAYDEFQNRIYANDEFNGKCFCLACGEPLRRRAGLHNRPHFAHLPDSNCAYGKDKDCKSEWHIHMQSFFPNDCIEVPFRDDSTGELHIADVYIADSKTVIEFQHSPISDKEFVTRTQFHLSHGRRIVWVFDERKEGFKYGRLRKSEYSSLRYPYYDLDFDWPRTPRKVLNSIQVGEYLGGYKNYSICVHLEDEDEVHRIIAQGNGFKRVVLSQHSIELNSHMDVSDFFRPDEYWTNPNYQKVEDVAEDSHDEMPKGVNVSNGVQTNRQYYLRRPVRRHRRM